jgi:FolB domain-containing protein
VNSSNSLAFFEQVSVAAAVYRITNSLWMGGKVKIFAGSRVPGGGAAANANGGRSAGRRDRPPRLTAAGGAADHRPGDPPVAEPRILRDRIVLRDLLVRGIVGVNDWEREQEQDILVNLEVATDTRAAGRSDDVADTLNYRTLAKAVIEHVESARPYLVEALAEAIARIAVAQGAERVRVRVEKPGAVRFAASVGVEIERERSDFG